jgi:hypothetical protein
MAVLESATDQAVKPLQRRSGLLGSCRRRGQARAGLNTLLALMLVALGVFVLRLAFVLALGTLG